MASYTVILPQNIWFVAECYATQRRFLNRIFRAMMHNCDDYPEPEKFIPERFIDTNGDIDKIAQDRLLTVIFGFGRRSGPVWTLPVPR